MREMLVGDRYPVTLVRARWVQHPVARWWPVLGKLHHDARDLHFPLLHWHLDFRFVPDDAAEDFRSCIGAPILLGRVVPVERGDEEMFDKFNMHVSDFERRTRDFERLFKMNRQAAKKLRQYPRRSWIKVERRKMLRTYDYLLDQGGHLLNLLHEKMPPDRWRIDPENPVCPHRQVDLSGVAVRDGRIRCPLHGLTFCARSGYRIFPNRNDGPLFGNQVATFKE